MSLTSRPLSVISSSALSSTTWSLSTAQPPTPPFLSACGPSPSSQSSLTSLCQAGGGGVSARTVWETCWRMIWDKVYRRSWTRCWETSVRRRLRRTSKLRSILWLCWRTPSVRQRWAAGRETLLFWSEEIRKIFQIWTDVPEQGGSLECYYLHSATSQASQVDRLH